MHVRSFFTVCLFSVVFGIYCTFASAEQTKSNETSAAGLASASPDSEMPDTKKHYRVGISHISVLPYFSAVEIENRGYVWEVLQLFAKANDIVFEYVAMPVSSLQPSMDKGDIDFIFPDHPSWRTFSSNSLPNIYSSSLVSPVSATFVDQENYALTIDKVKKVAVPFGYTAYTWMEPIKKYNIKTLPVRDLQSALFSVIQGTADAADVEYNIGQYLISQNHGLSKLTINPNLPKLQFDYHLSSIKHILVLEKLSVFMEQEQEALDSIFRRYNIKSFDEVYGKQESLID